jgi:hypothetical protein
METKGREPKKNIYIKKREVEEDANVNRANNMKEGTNQNQQKLIRWKSNALKFVRHGKCQDIRTT